MCLKMFCPGLEFFSKLVFIASFPETLQMYLSQPSCPSHVPLMSPSCPSHVPLMSPSCPSHVPLMSLSCPPHVPLMSLSCPPHVPLMSPSCPSHVPLMSPSCPSHVPLMSLSCPPHVPLCVQELRDAADKLLNLGYYHNTVECLKDEAQLFIMLAHQQVAALVAQKHEYYIEVGWPSWKTQIQLLVSFSFLGCR